VKTGACKLFNAKIFAILHFGSKHVQNILALNFLQNVGPCLVPKFLAKSAL